jgi:hypothetical protein
MVQLTNNLQLPEIIPPDDGESSSSHITIRNPSEDRQKEDETEIHISDSEEFDKSFFENNPDLERHREFLDNHGEVVKDLTNQLGSVKPDTKIHVNLPCNLDERVMRVAIDQSNKGTLKDEDLETLRQLFDKPLSQRS